MTPKAPKRGVVVVVCRQSTTSHKRVVHGEPQYQNNRWTGSVLLLLQFRTIPTIHSADNCLTNFAARILFIAIYYLPVVRQQCSTSGGSSLARRKYRITQVRSLCYIDGSPVSASEQQQHIFLAVECKLQALFSN